MKTIKKTLIIGLLICSNQSWGQTINPKYVGVYKDASITELSLHEDGTFKLKTTDDIFPYTFQDFENKGNWISRGDTVFLNPDKKRKEKTIDFIEKQTETNDSITIKINFFVDYYDEDLFLEREKFEFDLMTVCINKKKKYYHLTHQPQIKPCLFAPKVKNQVLVDSTNTFKIPAQKMTKIGLFTYGFDQVEWLDISNRETDFIEITIAQPVEKNRIPQNRMVIMKRGQAYYYMREDKIEKSVLMTGLGLVKQK